MIDNGESKNGRWIIPFKKLSRLIVKCILLWVLYNCYFISGPGIAINCMSINETFCVTGSDDGFMRLWPLDFAHVYLEAEHEGPVTAVDFSSDGLKILAGTAQVYINYFCKITGNLHYLLL